jgi:hypothetical protein
MSLTEGLLIVIVIVLTIMIITRRQGKTAPGQAKTWDCVDRASGEVTSVKMQYNAPPAAKSPEGATLKENAEFFTAQSAGSDHLVYACGDEDKFAFAVDDFGAPGMDYKSYIASQSVDAAVVKNHMEFVKDRVGDNTKNVTGPTRSFGEIEDDGGAKWIGLRRPQAIPESSMGSPTQVTDFRESGFTKTAKFTWNSSV